MLASYYGGSRSKGNQAGVTAWSRIHKPHSIVSIRDVALTAQGLRARAEDHQQRLPRSSVLLAPRQRTFHVVD